MYTSLLLLSASAVLSSGSGLAYAQHQLPPPSLGGKKGCLVSDTDTSSPNQAAGLLPRQASPSIPTSITVQVHLHIASTVNDTTLLADSILSTQFSTLQSAFAPQNILLNWNSTSRTVSDKAGNFFFLDEREEGSEFPKYVEYREEREEWKKGTRRGGYDELNLWVYSRYLPGATGYCTWPTVRSDTETDILSLDGCDISGLTMAGISREDGGFEDYNDGHMMVHETGHWFGLNHTFVGSCTSPTGDFVDDTPAQRSEIYGCPVASDSCPDQAGLDPVHNFMGYTADNCTSEFTPGQKKRMFETFFGFRRALPAGS